jgi:hypothetical protein
MGRAYQDLDCVMRCLTDAGENGGWGWFGLVERGEAVVAIVVGALAVGDADGEVRTAGLAAFGAGVLAGARRWEGEVAVGAAFGGAAAVGEEGGEKVAAFEAVLFDFWLGWRGFQI